MGKEFHRNSCLNELYKESIKYFQRPFLAHVPTGSHEVKCFIRLQWDPNSQGGLFGLTAEDGEGEEVGVWV